MISFRGSLAEKSHAGPDNGNVYLSLDPQKYHESKTRGQEKFIRFHVNIVGESQSETHDISVAEVLGFSTGTSKTKANESLTETFTVHLNPSKHFDIESTAEIGPFEVGGHDLSESLAIQIDDYWDSLSPDVHQSIQNGETQIIVEGFCSSTGERAENMELSKMRSKVVAEYLQGYVGIPISGKFSGPEIITFGFGEQRSRYLKDNWESPSYRCCFIYLNKVADQD